MVRENILNLNGPWQWDVGPGDGDPVQPPFNTTLPGTILARCQLPHLLATCEECAGAAVPALMRPLSVLPASLCVSISAL